MPSPPHDQDPGAPRPEVAGSQGQLALAISNAVVSELSRTTGRGPTQARTTLGTNAVFVILQDSLTRGERSLVAAGEGAAVLDLRRRWQSVMREACCEKVEELTGREVVGFMSDNHIDPDIGVEVFVLAPSSEHATADNDDALR